jgi:hypothetical protein
MYFIRLDVHKKTISYCVKDAGRPGSRGRQARVDTARTGLLDQDTSTAENDCHGSDDLYWLDLRPSAAACGEGQGSSPPDAAGDCTLWTTFRPYFAYHLAMGERSSTTRMRLAVKICCLCGRHFDAMLWQPPGERVCEACEAKRSPAPELRRIHMSFASARSLVLHFHGGGSPHTGCAGSYVYQHRQYGRDDSTR